MRFYDKYDQLGLGLYAEETAMEYLDHFLSFLPYILVVCLGLLVLVKLKLSDLIESVALQARRPTTGFAGWFVKVS